MQWLPHFQFQSMYIDPNQDWIKEYSINIVQLSIQASTGTVCQLLHCLLTIGVHHRTTRIADLHYRITWYSCIGVRVHGITIENVWRVRTAWYKASCSYDQDDRWKIYMYFLFCSMVEYLECEHYMNQSRDTGWLRWAKSREKAGC